MRSEPRWISKRVALALHERLLAEHGGVSGILDEGLLDAALANPRNQLAYRRADIFRLAAAYAHSLTQNHPFSDGNKRVAVVASTICMVLMVFLCIAYVQQERGHIRITLLEKYMPARLNIALNIFSDCVSILIIGFLCWRAFINEKYIIEIKMMKQGTIQFPLWPSNLAVFFGWAGLLIVYLLHLSKTIFAKAKP